MKKIRCTDCFDTGIILKSDPPKRCHCQKQINSLYDDAELARITKQGNSNPMVMLYGKLPGEKKCKTCTFLFAKQFANRYYKCGFRQCTGGRASDHRIGWDACKKYEEDENSCIKGRFSKGRRRKQKAQTSIKDSLLGAGSQCY